MAAYSPKLRRSRMPLSGRSKSKAREAGVWSDHLGSETAFQRRVKKVVLTALMRWDLSGTSDSWKHTETAMQRAPGRTRRRTSQVDAVVAQATHLDLQDIFSRKRPKQSLGYPRPKNRRLKSTQPLAQPKRIVRQGAGFDPEDSRLRSFWKIESLALIPMRTRRHTRPNCPKV